MNNKYLILIVVVIGAFLGNLEAAIPNAAISTIEENLNSNVQTTTWVLTIYTLLFATAMPIASKLGSILGHRNLYIYSLFLFSIFSILCGVVNDINLLIIFRALQGISISASLPCAMIIIAQQFNQSERGKAMGIFGMTIAASTAIGAPLGGVLSGYLGWQSMFYIVAPLGFIGVILSIIFLPRENKEKQKISFDIVGATSFSLFVILLMVLISNLTKGALFSIGNIILLVLTVILFVIFIRKENKIKEPFIPLSLFKYRDFINVSLSRTIQMALLYGSLFAIPLYWSRTYSVSTENTGIGLFILPLTIMIISPISGNLIDKFGSKIFMILGMIFSTLGMFILVVMPGDLWSVSMTTSLVLLGIGFAMMQSSSMSAVTLTLPKEYLSIGVGIFNMITFTGGTIGLSIFSSLISTFNFNVTFLVMTILSFIAILLILKVKITTK